MKVKNVVTSRFKVKMSLSYVVDIKERVNKILINYLRFIHMM